MARLRTLKFPSRFTSEHLAQIRSWAGLSPARMARKMGCSKATYLELESGKRGMTALYANAAWGVVAQEQARVHGTEFDYMVACYRLYLPWHIV